MLLSRVYICTITLKSYPLLGKQRIWTRLGLHGYPGGMYSIGQSTMTGVCGQLALAAMSRYQSTWTAQSSLYLW